MMKPSEILDKVLLHCNTNYNKLAKDLGVKRSQSLYDIRDGKTNISHKLAEKITKIYPEINKGWLLTGDGEMLKNSNENPNVDARVSELERLLAERNRQVIERDKQVSELQNEVRLLLEAKEKDRLLLQAKDEIIALLKKQNAATERGKVGREGKVYA